MVIEVQIVGSDGGLNFPGAHNEQRPSFTVKVVVVEQGAAVEAVVAAALQPNTLHENTFSSDATESAKGSKI